MVLRCCSEGLLSISRKPELGRHCPDIATEMFTYQFGFQRWGPLPAVGGIDGVDHISGHAFCSAGAGTTRCCSLSMTYLHFSWRFVFVWPRGYK